MRKAVSLSLFLVLAMAGTAWAGQTGTFEEARSLAAKSGKPVLLDFFTEW